MRPRARLWLAMLGMSSLMWVVLGSAFPPGGQGASGSSATQSPPVFTPAHPTALDAIKDFFERRHPPVQPVAFTHNVHLTNRMRCTNCHVGVDQGPEAAIPNVQLCMTCHRVIGANHPEIKKVAAYMARGEEIPWERVYDYSRSAHVKFDHAAHIRAKVACASCHGDMTRQTTAQRAVNLTIVSGGQ